MMKNPSFLRYNSHIYIFTGQGQRWKYLFTGGGNGGKLLKGLTSGGGRGKDTEK